MEWLIYLALGAVAGLLAGLFGIGGGSIIVPMLILMYGVQSFPVEVIAQLAVGTSFAIIVVTSCSSVLAHHRVGNVNWLVFKSLIVGLVVGVGLGSLVATSIESRWLQLLVALFFMLVAVQMFFQLQPAAQSFSPGRIGQAIAGAIIGGVSAFIGIGGGSMSIPYFKTCGMPMRQAVGTSAACGLPIAVFGAFVYALAGHPMLAEVPYTTGFIFWPAMLGVGIASTPAAKLGAWLATRLPEALMVRLFALLLFGVSIYLAVS